MSKFATHTYQHGIITDCALFVLALRLIVLVRRGSSSTVKKAEIQSTGELVAVKVSPLQNFRGKKSWKTTLLGS